MKKFFLISLLALTLICAAAITYIGISHESLSKMSADAHAALRAKDYKTASQTIGKILNKDAANEDAYLMLAEIAREKKEFFDAARFWEKLILLNPLNPNYVDNMIEDIMKSQSDEMMALKYSGLSKSKKFSDKVVYCAAMGNLRMGLLDKFAEIQKELKKKNSPYDLLIEAELACVNSKFEDAKNHYLQIKEKYPELKNDAILGLAKLAIINGNFNEAQNYLDLLNPVPIELEGDVALMSGQIQMLKKDFKKAYEFYKLAAKIQKSNLQLMLDCVELASSQNDDKTIADFRSRIELNSKEAIFMDYYFAALQSSIKGDYKNARQALKRAGDFQQRNIAKILAFKLAVQCDDPKEAANIVLSTKIQFKGTLLKAFENDLFSLAKKHSQNEEIAVDISKAMLKLNPDCEYALRVMLAANTAERNFSEILIMANRILSKYPLDNQANRAKALALLNLELFNEGFQLAKKFADSPATDSFWLSFASRFAMAVNDKKSALEYAYKAVCKDDIPAEVAFNFCRYAIANSENKDYEKFIDAIKSKDLPIFKFAEKILRAEMAKRAGDIVKAKDLYKQALQILPNSELARIELASIEYENKNMEEALKLLQQAAQNNPNSLNVKTRLSAILMEIGGEQNSKNALEIIVEQIKNNPKNAYLFSMKSQALAQLNEPQQALQAAQEAEALAPQNPQILHQLANSLKERGRNEEAYTILLKSAKISPNKNIIEELENTLLELKKSAPSKLYLKSLADLLLKIAPDSQTAKKIYEQSDKKD